MDVQAATSSQTVSRVAPAHLRSFSATIRVDRPESNRFGTGRNPALEVAIGDLTQDVSDAVVNPVGAGLVDLALRRAAGPELVEAFHQSTWDLPGHRLLPGQAVLTAGFGLPAAHVIHCRPPVYADNPQRARENLAACHVEALRLARERGFKSIAFPAIATGVYRFPVEEAAEIAVRTVVAELRAHRAPTVVRFVLFHPLTLKVYEEAAWTHFGAHARRDQRGTAFSVTDHP